MDTHTLLFAFLVTLACGGLLYAFVYPLLSGEAKLEKRQAAIRQPIARNNPRGGRAVDPTQRRKQVAESLKELEARSKTKRLSLEAKLAQAGLHMDRRQYFLLSAVAAVCGGALVLLLTHNLLFALGGLVIGGFGVPNWILSFLRKRRIKKFAEEFPNAIDVIVRGIRSGLPLADCVRVIATEASDPVKSEFRMVVETQALGMSIADAVARMVERVPVTETNFFSIVITIQQKSGGSLAESLANLSRVLRERRKMKSKVSAMSMEAKASAAIIASLPFIVAILVYLTSPKYMMLLWTTTTGLIDMGVCGVWMLIGVFVMRSMINFDV
jgi:tight adherence protein B